MLRNLMLTTIILTSSLLHGVIIENKSSEILNVGVFYYTKTPEERVSDFQKCTIMPYATMNKDNVFGLVKINSDTDKHEAPYIPTSCKSKTETYSFDGRKITLVE